MPLRGLHLKLNFSKEIIMALPNGAGGYQVGAGNRQETIMGAFAAPQTADGAWTVYKIA